MASVLITGAARGIGRTTVLRLASKGWTLYAGVRKHEDGEQLVAAGGSGIVPVQLDITSAGDLAQLPSSLGEQLDAIVNNAGYVEDGPLEAVSPEALRRQLEVNVVGQVAVTQAVLPLLRASEGRIVFVSSLNGRISTPMSGAYNASKFALEAIADALRVELRPWKVKVVVVQPGATDTDIWRGALDTHADTEAALSPEHRALYERHFAATGKMLRQIQKRAVPAERVAADIERALTAARPRARYPVGLANKAQLGMAAATPTAVLDAVLARSSGAR